MKLGGILVELGALAVAICRAGLTCGGLGGILVALGASAVAIFRAGLTCGGRSGNSGRTGSFGCRYKTGGRLRRRIMGGFDIEF